MGLDTTPSCDIAQEVIVIPQSDVYDILTSFDQAKLVELIISVPKYSNTVLHLCSK